MTALAPTPAPEVVDDAPLAERGIHRDPRSALPTKGTTFSQRLVHRASGLLRGKTNRRSFLTRTAVVGSALAVGPLDFVLKPGTAYGYVCGTCSDGWTAFCCTINAGRNVCPPDSFVAGWWKADNAAYCCGSARYIIDCNATCPTQCSCRCAGDSCDGRRTCCNQFRYGQCNTQISCYGPVVCRVATCTPAWEYDPNCTTSSATDNRTVNHGSGCLSENCGTPISEKYESLGGASGFLGAVRVAEKGISDRRGRVERYVNGNIYWTSTTGAHEVHGPILSELSRQGGVTGPLKYPTSDQRRSHDGRSYYSNFENGRIYQRDGVTVTIPQPFFAKHESMRGVAGFLGYPSDNVRTSGDRRSRYQNFEKGRLYLRDGRMTEIHGAVYTLHESIFGVYGELGYPVTDLGSIGDAKGGKAQWFERGLVWYSRSTGAHGVWGKTLDRYTANGHTTGYLRYPTSEPTPVGDGRGTYATFERGHIYSSTTTDGHQVHGAVLDAYLNTHGGPTGVLGYPVSELPPRGTPGGRVQRFEGGTLTYISDNTPVIFTPA